MKKNILKKFIILFVLGFILLGSNYVFAEDSIPDITPPVIILNGNGDANISLNVGDTYLDADSTASDNIDGDITTKIVSVNNVNVSIAGTYTITYDVKDAAGNNAIQVIRTVVINEIVPPAPKENFIIRNGDDLIWEGQFDLPDSGKVSIVGKEVDSKSVLGVLYLIGENSGAFSVSDLKDYGSMGLYLKCITPKDKTPLCENWQYAVGATTPWTSIDTTLLSGGEIVGIYFGNSHHVVIDKTNLNVGDILSATSEKYNYENNIWSPLTGVSIGLTTPNPNDEWNPNIIGTYPVDLNGNTKILINNPNTYNLGIVEDYYFPSYSVVASPIIEKGGGGGGGGFIIIPKSFSIENAISYLSSKQKSDGSFGDFFYTDWVTIGVATSSLGQDIKTKILDYFKNNSLNSSIITDNERHAMALMSLGLNPYNGTNVDYISKIINSFDGVQFGDSSLDNDDIFALIVLSKAGYNSSDEKIIKDVNYLISKQLSDGSWGSIDMTAAGIQALNNFRDINGASDSISKALKYLVKSQQNDGGFGNSFATSWAIGGLSVESALYNSEIKKANDYLISKQQIDGGLENLTDDIDNRIWSTSYAIPAILKLSWNNIMKSFPKEEIIKSTEPLNEDKIITETIDNKDINIEEVGTGEIVAITKNEEKINTLIKINKKENISETKILLSNEEKLINSPLSATAIGSTQNSITFLSIINTIIEKIEAPFIWLFIRLGF